MKRTTIYFDPALELRLKAEGVRRNQPMAELVREAVEVYLAGGPADGPPGGGAFASGHADTADRADEILARTGFGGGLVRTPVKRAPKPRPSTKPGARSKRRA